MYKNQKICVIIPAYNEEKNIKSVICSIPDFVDNIIVVNDGSSDNTFYILSELVDQNNKLKVLNHKKNKGNGAARISGLKESLNLDTDVICLLDGDGQMDIEDMPRLLGPIVDENADFSKGNRFFSGEAWTKIPKIRYMGNAFLSLLTKIASGYWHLADSQTGYIAVKKEVISKINLDHLYHDYGFPNDLIIHANVVKAVAVDVPIKPVYNIGEKSNLKIWKVMPKITWLLFKRFLWRLKEVYIIRDFHPLVFFYIFGVSLFFVSIPLFARIIYIWAISGSIPKVNVLALMFTMISGLQFILFAMWFDMDYNRRK